MDNTNLNEEKISDIVNDLPPKLKKGRGSHLIPLNQRPYEEMRAIQKKGNEAMKRNAEKRKQMKEQLETLLSLKVSNKNKALRNQMAEMGFAEEDMNNQLALLLNIFNQALVDSKDATKAAEFIRDTSGQSPTQKQLQVQTDFETFIKNIEGEEF